MQGNGNAQGGPVLPGARHSEPGPNPRRPVRRLANLERLAADSRLRRVEPWRRPGDGRSGHGRPAKGQGRGHAITAALAPSSDSSSSNGITAAWKPVSRTGGGGAMAARAAARAMGPFHRRSPHPGWSPRTQALKRLPRPRASPACTFLRAQPVAPAGPRAHTRPPWRRQRLQGGTGFSATPDASGSPTGPTITENPSSTPYSPTSGGFDSPLVSFPYYPLYTLDYIQGNVLFPGGEQLATLDGNVDLRAQVKNTTGVTFSWNTKRPDQREQHHHQRHQRLRPVTFTWDTLVTMRVVTIFDGLWFKISDRECPIP